MCVCCCWFMCVCVVSGVCVCDPVGLCACVCVIYGCVYNVLLECCVRVQKIGKEAVMFTVDSFVSVPFVDSTVFAAHFCFIPSAHFVISSAVLQTESCFSDWQLSPFHCCFQTANWSRTRWRHFWRCCATCCRQNQSTRTPLSGHKAPPLSERCFRR